MNMSIRRPLVLAMAASLFTSTMLSTAASAQVPLRQRLPVPAGNVAASESAANKPLEHRPTIGRPLDEVIVEGDMEAVNKRDLPPNAARYLAYTAQHTLVNRQDWVDRGWNEGRFDAIRKSNVGLCVKTTSFILRIEDLVKRYVAHIPELAAIRDRYVKLGDSIRTASYSRTGSNIISSIIGWIFGGPVTGAIVTSGAVGNEMQGQAWDKSMEVSRDAGILNSDVMKDHIDFNLLSLEVYTDYLGFMSDYCNQHVLKDIPASDDPASYDAPPTTAPQGSYDRPPETPYRQPSW